MQSRFSFDGALMFAFRAPHVRSFPWIFSAAFAGVFTAFLLLVMLLASGDARDVISAFEALDQAGFDDDDPRALISLVLSAFEPLIGWGVFAMLGSWVIWAVFESASQRRYIRDEGFSLGFGGDELRMMGVGFCWAVVQTVFTVLPVMMIFGSIMGVFDLIESGASEDEIARSIIGPIFGALGVWFLLFLVYIFFATRLAPCFALTIKDRQFRFLDAWNVSRGRFWPILGAYVIITIVGGIVVSIAEQILEFGLIGVLTPALGDAQTGEDFLSVFMSGSVLVVLAVYFLIRLFLSGLLMHVAGGPAALAARHDPRGGVDDALQADIFN